jgi:hypothetical protein
VAKVTDESLLDLYVRDVRANYPDSAIFVREVVEVTVWVIKDNGEEIRFEKYQPPNPASPPSPSE